MAPGRKCQAIEIGFTNKEQEFWWINRIKPYIYLSMMNLNLIMGNNQECVEFDSIVDAEKDWKMLDHSNHLGT